MIKQTKFLLQDIYETYEAIKFQNMILFSDTIYQEGVQSGSFQISWPFIMECNISAVK